MTTTISRIENVGPDARARLLSFADYSPCRRTSAAVLKLLALEAGMEVELCELERELAEQEPRLARERALQLLRYRERSCAELHERLIDNGYPKQVVDAVVTRFCEVELVDDRRFASAWVRSRAGAGYGRLRIQRELAGKGVDADIVLAAIEEELPQDELGRARDSLRGRRPRDAKDRERLVRRLVARGYELAVSLEAVGSSSDLRGAGESDAQERI